MTIGSTGETSMNYLFSSVPGKKKLIEDYEKLFVCVDFQEWKDSIAAEARMPGGLSSETRQKVRKTETRLLFISLF